MFRVLSTAQFWSKIIFVISNRTRAARSFNFEISSFISDQIGIALFSVKLKLGSVTQRLSCTDHFLSQPQTGRTAFIGAKLKDSYWKIESFLGTPIYPSTKYAGVKKFIHEKTVDLFVLIAFRV